MSWLTPWPKRSPPCRSSCAVPSPGTRAKRWPSTPGSAWRPACRSTSAIPTAPGSGAATRTPTGCYASTFPAAPTSERSRRATSTTSLLSSTAGLDKRSDGSHHVRHWMRRCNDRLRPRFHCGPRAGSRCAKQPRHTPSSPAAPCRESSCCRRDARRHLLRLIIGVLPEYAVVLCEPGGEHEPVDRVGPAAHGPDAGGGGPSRRDLRPRLPSFGLSCRRRSGSTRPELLAGHHRWLCGQDRAVGGLAHGATPHLGPGGR